MAWSTSTVMGGRCRRERIAPALVVMLALPLLQSAHGAQPLKLIRARRSQAALLTKLLLDFGALLR
jgi:hypothetical protein